MFSQRIQIFSSDYGILDPSKNDEIGRWKRYGTGKRIGTDTGKTASVLESIEGYSITDEQKLRMRIVRSHLTNQTDDLPLYRRP